MYKRFHLHDDIDDDNRNDDECERGRAVADDDESGHERRHCEQPLT